MPLPRSQPLVEWPAESACRIRGVLTDIDDTLTTEGAITTDALDALHRLKTAGLHVAAITGRPLGWSEPFAIAWPVDAIVAENGGVALIRQSTGVEVEFAQDAATRATHAQRLREVAERILREIPQAQLARDSAGRVTDIAIDHSEFTSSSPEYIAQVAALMRSEGMHASVSSIHVNGWYGDHDKRSAARWIVRRLYGLELDDEPQRWIYVGDSTNDQALFSSLPLTFGVANLLRFEHELLHWPRYLTRGERGAGFAEVVDRIMDARSCASSAR